MIAEELHHQEPQKKVLLTKITTEVMSAEEFLKNSYSLIYNVRDPSRRYLPYKAMLRQLKIAPQNFFNKNSGVTIANDEFLIDGGNTSLALSDAQFQGCDLSQVRVKVTRMHDLSVEQMKDASRGLNYKTQQPNYGIRDLEGAWNNIKAILSDKYKHLFEFRPNSMPNAPYKVTFLVALIHALNSRVADKSYSSKGVIAKNYTDEKYQKVLPLLNEAIEIYSMIHKDLAASPIVSTFNGRSKRLTILPNGEAVKPTIPAGYLFPVFSAFAYALTKDGRWIANPTAIWEQSKDSIIALLDQRYKKCGKNANKVGKDRTTYVDLGAELYAVATKLANG
jgi:hypothetical protein